LTYSTFNDLKRVLDEFNNKHQRPHGKLALTSLFDISTQPRTASWPSNGKPGVYVFLDSDKFITYIGKASDNIGSRLSARFYVSWESKTKESSDCAYIDILNDLYKIQFFKIKGLIVKKREESRFNVTKFFKFVIMFT